MKEPEKPYPPISWEFEKEFEEKILHQITYVHPEITEDVTEMLLEQEDTDSEEELDILKKKLNIQEWGYNEEISLNTILSYMPKNGYVGADRNHRL